MNAQIERNAGSQRNSILAGDLDGSETCLEVIGDCEVLMKAVCKFNSRLLGDGGARAVLARAITLATPGAPVVQKIVPTSEGGDFTELRKCAETEEYDVADIHNALVHLKEEVFFTLSDLTGNLLTGPLLQVLQKGD